MSEHQPWCHWWWALLRHVRGEDERVGLPTPQQQAVARWQEDLLNQLEAAAGTLESAQEESLARLRADLQTISRKTVPPDAA